MDVIFRPERDNPCESLQYLSPFKSIVWFLTLGWMDSFAQLNSILVYFVANFMQLSREKKSNCRTVRHTLNYFAHGCYLYNTLSDLNNDLSRKTTHINCYIEVMVTSRVFFAVAHCCEFGRIINVGKNAWITEFFSSIPVACIMNMLINL